MKYTRKSLLITFEEGPIKPAFNSSLELVYLKLY